MKKFMDKEKIKNSITLLILLIVSVCSVYRHYFGEPKEINKYIFETNAVVYDYDEYNSVKFPRVYYLFEFENGEKKVFEIRANYDEGTLGKTLKSEFYKKEVKLIVDVFEYDDNTEEIYLRKLIAGEHEFEFYTEKEVGSMRNTSYKLLNYSE